LRCSPPWNARRRGYVVRKSRAWKHVPHLNNRGEYMLIDPEHNCPVLGYRFDASLDNSEA
jgi:hypothetical protein